jgi:hypothetical protein
MGKRSYTTNPAVIEAEHEEALRSSKRRAVQVAPNTTAIALLALWTEALTASSEVAFPSNESLLPPQPHHRQARSVEDSVSAISDDEDENKTNIVPDVFYVDHIGVFLVQPAPRKPILSIAGTRRCEASNYRKLPFGRPLPAAPVLPSSLLSRGGIPSTGFVTVGQSYLLGTSECPSNTKK